MCEKTLAKNGISLKFTFLFIGACNGWCENDSGSPELLELEQQLLEPEELLEELLDDLLLLLATISHVFTYTSSSRRVEGVS